MLNAAGSLAKHQSTRAATVTFAYIPRADTPGRDELTRIVGAARLVEFGDATLNTVARLRLLRSRIKDAIATGAFDVIHAHSSLAGFALRTLSGRARRQVVTCYSPHGFAFLRQDVGPVVRSTFLLAERLCGNRAALIAVSPSESKIARDSLKVDAYVLPNSGDVPAGHRDPKRGAPIRVGMVGRVTYAKAPWRFAAAARRFSDRAEFVWVGSGDPAEREKWLGDAPVEITGWLEGDSLVNELEDLDILYYPTLWEGMPLSLINAQLLGIPVVATDIVGNRDVVIDGETGILANSEDSLHSALGDLIDNANLREKLGRAASVRASERFDPELRADQSFDIYASIRRQQQAQRDR